jgi:hypothetical protein
MGIEHVSVSKTSLKAYPDEVTLRPKGNDRVCWSFEGREGDIFMVAIAKGGCFRNAPDGLHRCVIGRGRTRAMLRTDPLRVKTRCDLKYAIIRIRDGRVKTVDPRIKIRE